MKKTLLLLVVMLAFGFGHAQTKNNAWTTNSTSELKANSASTDEIKSRAFSLDLSSFKKNLNQVQQRGVVSRKTAHMMSFPSIDGAVQGFRIVGN